jgi:hypothetical protein
MTTLKMTKLVLIEYKLDLSRYSEEQLKRLWKDGVISKQEMNDELDDRERMATVKDRAS